MGKEELFIPKPKHKGLKIMLAILLIAGLIVGGYFLYKHKFNDPNSIVNNVFEEARNSVKESLKKVDNKGIYKIDGHVKIDSNINTDEIGEILTILKDLELQFSGETDSKKIITNFNISSKYKNDALFGIKGRLEDNTIYVLLDGLYDKYLKLESHNTMTPTDAIVDSDDIETIIDALLTAGKKEFTKLDIKKNDTKTTVNGKEIDVIDNYIELKDKEVNDLIKNIINNLKNNQKFLDVIKKLLKTDAKEMLDGIEKNINKDEFKGTYKISFYTDKGLLNKKLISIKQSITQNNITTSIIIDKISDDEMMISIQVPTTQYSIKYKLNKSIANVVLSMNSMGAYINIEFSANYEPINEVSKLDVSNSKNIEDLTQEEEQEIEKKFMENKTLLKLIEEINKITKKELN